MKNIFSLTFLMLSALTIFSGCGNKKKVEPQYNVKIEGAIDARQSGVLNDPDIRWNVEEDFK